MVDPTLAVAINIILGAAGGFLSSWMAFNASGETFNGRKHGNAIITGILTGIALGAAVVVTDPSNMELNTFIILAITTFLSAVGIDRLRSSTSHTIANNPTLEDKKASPA